MIQRAMWTKLGSSDCMNRVMKSIDEGEDSSRALWYSAIGVRKVHSQRLSELRNVQLLVINYLRLMAK